jgi:signal transduction histidine kinase
LKVRVQNELLQLSIHASEFRLEDQYHKLISMQNIRNELDVREMEAWQKLIRVLTHEIMNSVSPIISLSETMQSVVERNEENFASRNSDLYNTLARGLDAIKVRSEGLYNFTQSYRKLTGIPTVSLKETTTSAIFDRVVVLLESKLKEKGIVLRTSCEELPVTVDPELMEHVLINLLLNAVDALRDTVDPQVVIGCRRGAGGAVYVYVRDNGEGIDEVTGEKIFVPFFTTRKHGSGIGLALVKQILQLHQADITFTSEKGKGAEFLVRL